MQFALINNERQEAQPNFSGVCPSCDDPVIAKCGKVKIPHWAHRGKRMCDQWWENETEWHRNWKGLFPKECQEIIHYAETGEKHIADVKTNEGYIVEFQHSPIKPEEREARENFYKNIIWIVDGKRRLRDKDQFDLCLGNSLGVFGDVEMLELHFHKHALLRDWGGSSVPVFFDFNEDILWAIIPKTIEKRFYAFKIDRTKLVLFFQTNNLETLLKKFTGSIASHEWYLKKTKNKMNLLDQHYLERRYR